MKSIVNGETIQFVNGYYEKKGAEITKYYYAGASQVAVRKYTVPESTTLHYMIGNHLGSASVVMDDAGTFVSETRYKPWGEVRYTTANKTLPTRYTFTGQYSHMDDSATDLGAAGFGLMFYNARWYDPMTGRFAQADSIVPGGVQGLDRYAYVNNNPMRYIDPSGHEPGVCGGANQDPECDPEYIDPWKPTAYFFRSPVSEEDLEWIQWFGGTQFAFEEGSSYDYHKYCQGYHCGIDFGADWGDPVYAGVYGVVVSSGNKGKGGYYIIIQVGDVYIKYEGLDGNFYVDVGDTVTPNTVIAGVGNHSGDKSDGNFHLHLEIRFYNKSDPNKSGEYQDSNRIINPLIYMSPSVYQLLLSVEPNSPIENVTFHNLGDDPLSQLIVVLGGGSLWR